VRIGDLGVLPKTAYDISMNEAKHWNSSQGDSDDGTGLSMSFILSVVFVISTQWRRTYP
jgi:hypothetical protein